MPAIKKKKKKTEFFVFVKKTGNPFKNGKVASLLHCSLKNKKKKKKKKGGRRRRRRRKKRLPRQSDRRFIRD